MDTWGGYGRGQVGVRSPRSNHPRGRAEEAVLQCKTILSDYRNDLLKPHPNWNLRENLTRGAIRPRDGLGKADKGNDSSGAAGALTAPLVVAGFLRVGVSQDMAKYSVRIRGDELDLRALAEHLNSAYVNVSKDEDGHYYLRSLDFETAVNNAAVYDHALELITRINRVATLLLGENYFPVEYDSLFYIGKDGRRHQTVFKDLNIMYKTRSKYLSASAEEMKSLLILTEHNQNVADALRFFMKDDWGNLYKAWEMARDAAGGQQQLIDKGWADEHEQKRFTRTAQSRAELGDEARHAAKKYTPPKNPMSKNEARSFIRSTLQGSTLQAWIDSAK